MVSKNKSGMREIRLPPEYRVFYESKVWVPLSCIHESKRRPYEGHERLYTPVLRRPL
jgi:hypothetical protein